MADREYVLNVIQRLHPKPPNDVSRRFSDDNAGIACMLKYLYDAEKPVSAGEISRFMRVSTARVSVLLKKMYEKDYIIRDSCSEDARRLMISLSGAGKAEFIRRQEKMIETFSLIIDRIGTERMEEFISVSNEIRDIVSAEIKKEINNS
ncbi:MAG: MarR family transcriptional regulator [Ruminococcus sp.]|nr:MarR family transcriptional regulator [Ruminococcus sp.]